MGVQFIIIGTFEVWSSNTDILDSNFSIWIMDLCTVIYIFQLLVLECGLDTWWTGDMAVLYEVKQTVEYIWGRKIEDMKFDNVLPSRHLTKDIWHLRKEDEDWRYKKINQVHPSRHVTAGRTLQQEISPTFSSSPLSYITPFLINVHTLPTYPASYCYQSIN